MPELSRFFGLIIKIQYRDHVPPHVHVWYGKRDRAIVSIADGSVLRGDLPKPQLVSVMHWVFRRQHELWDAWDKTSHHLKPQKIAPLKD